MGLSTKAWRSMVARGLRAVACGKQKFVIGQDALDFFRGLGNGRPDLAARHAADDEDVGAALAAGVVGPDGEGR